MDLKKLISNMTIEEKIGQLTQYNANLFIDSNADVTGLLNDFGLSGEDLKNVGSVLNFSNADEVRKIQKLHLEQDRNKIPMTFMMDVIHGYRTIYPIPLGLGASFDPDLVAEATRVAAKEAAAAGVQVTFTPMVDYVRDPRWGRVMECCGEEPLLNGILGAAQVKAFQGEGIEHSESLATCVKHFAAYGGAEAGRDYNTVEISEHTLREYYLPAYKACLDAGADMLMPSFNVLNGVPATANSWLMKKILKEEWQSDVLVISDYGAVSDLMMHGVAENLKEAAKLAFENGCHIEMCSGGYINHLKELIEEGTFSEEQLDAAVLKVLELKERLGLFEDPFHGASPQREAEVCLTQENREIVRRVAEQCAVLLKNNGVLPFSKAAKKIAIIGPFADNHYVNGFWHCQGRAEDTVTVKEGVERLLPDAEITVVGGCGNFVDDFDKSQFEQAKQAARNADIVILALGEPEHYSGEGNCRTDIDLTGVQNELAEEIVGVNPNTAVLLFTGRPLAVKRLHQCAPAILNMWFSGTESGSAAANLLFGEANPCGKLSMTFPQAVGQCPIYYNHLLTGKPKPTEQDDTYFPYRSNYIDCGNLPLYSFGHGLSYSDFVYEDLTLSKPQFTADETVTVTVTVFNNSNTVGKETVMLYMRDLVASTSRPIQQLIAFRKIELKAYERKTVSFEINEKMLGFWNAENEFVTEKGKFQISTGYADHLILTKELELC